MIERALAGPIGLFVKFSTLQEYGIDKVFFLENENVDTSQKNVIFLVRGEEAETSLTVAGELQLSYIQHFTPFISWQLLFSVLNVLTV